MINPKRRRTIQESSIRVMLYLPLHPGDCHVQYAELPMKKQERQ
jgi:hypothetical protein